MNPFGDDVSAQWAPPSDRPLPRPCHRARASPSVAQPTVRFASLRFRSLVRSFVLFRPALLFLRVLFISSSRKQLDFEGGDPFGDGYEDDDDDGDDEAGGVAAARHYGAEHVLLLFDCDASMFERYVSCRRSSSSSSSSTNDDDDYVEEEGYFTGGKIGDGDENDDDDRRRMNRGLVRYSPMDVAATAAHRLLRAKVRDVAETKSGKRDGVGVLLYGCDPNRRRRLRRRRGDGGGGRDDDGVEIVVVDDDDDDDDDGGDEDPLPTTHELVELAAPGIEQVLTVQECLPDEDEDEGEDDDRGLRGRRRRRRRRGRDLRGEFSSVPRRRRKGGDDGGGGDGEGEGVEEEDDTLAVCGLLRGLTAALKIFASAK